MTTTRLVCAFLFVALALGSSAASAQEARHDARFQEAWYREIAEARFEEALEIYSDISEDAGASRELRGRALLRAGICHSKLGRKDEARQAFQKVLAEYADVQDAAATARREVEGESEEEASFRLKVEGLVSRLGSKGLYETVHTSRGSRQMRNPIVESLEEIGPRVAPYVFRALGRNDFYTAENAAELLVRFAESEAELQPQVIAALRSGDAIVQKSITAAIERNPYAGWIGTLAELCSDADENIRRVGVEALRAHSKSPTVRVARGKLAPDPRVVAALSQVAADPVPKLRLLAIQSLADLGGWALLDVFASAFGDADPHVRQAAVVAWTTAARVSSDADRIDAAALYPLLEDPQVAVAASAVDALGALNDKVRKGRGRADGAVPTILPQDPAEVLDHLAAIASSAEFSGKHRVAAVDLIGGVGLGAASPHLRRLLSADDPDVVVRAVEKILDLGDRESADDLLRLIFTSESSDVRQTAWRVLADGFKSPVMVQRLVENLPRLGPLAGMTIELFDFRKRRDLLVEALRHFAAVDEEARVALLDRVQSLGAEQGAFPEALAALRQGLEDPNVRVRREAAEAAVYYPETSLYPRLIELLADADDNVRHWALMAIPALADERAIPALVEILKEPEESRVNSARSILEDIAGPELVGDLLPLITTTGNLAHPAQVVWLISAIARPAHAPAIAATLPAVRADVLAEAIGVLGKLKNPVALEALRPFARSSDTTVRRAAIDALGDIGGEEALEILKRSIEDKQTSIRQAAAVALGELQGEEAFKALLRAFETERDHGVIRSMIAALWVFADSRAVPALVASVTDPERAARTPRPRPSRTSRSVTRTPTRPSTPRPTPYSLSAAGFPALDSLASYPADAVLLALAGLLKSDTRSAVKREALKVAARFRDDRALALVMSSRDDADSELRVLAIGILGEFMDPRALPPLVELLRDPNISVREAARKAIDEIRYYLEQKEFARRLAEGESR